MSRPDWNSLQKIRIPESGGTREEHRRENRHARRTGLGWLLRVTAPVIGLFARHGNLEVSYRGQNVVRLGDGDGPLYRIRIESLRMIPWVIRNPDLGCGESYMDGLWTIEKGDLAGLLGLFLRNYNDAADRPLGRLICRSGKLVRSRDNTPAASRRNAAHHYDIGNDLYSAFLDEGMNYSCAFFERPGQSLRNAQLNKLRTSARRLDIAPGADVLDIGCGWGEMTRVIANETDANRIVGITLAENQLRLARQRAGELEGRRPEYLLADYRDHANRNAGAYDRIVSIGMFEHVGRKHFVEYFSAVRRLLRGDGRALVHSIMRPERSATSAWIERYIFPGGYIPSLEDAVAAAREAGLELAHEPFIHESFHYAETLRRWRHNFNRAWPRLNHGHYDEHFRRMWNFYLCGSEAAFDANELFVGQLLLKKAR